MSIFIEKHINREHIKVRWQEPYVSHALNRKDFGVIPVGIYSGFAIKNTGYRSYQVTTDTAINLHGDSNSYNQGAYSAVSGYSVAVFQDLLAHNNTIVIPPGVSGTFDFDFLSGYDGQQVILAIDVDYGIGVDTAAQVVAVDAAEMAASPELLVIGVVNVPTIGVSGTDSDVSYYDTTYPRTLPIATPKKYGFMSPSQAQILAGIGQDADALFCSSNDANVYWFVDGVSGGVLQFDGEINYHLPTDVFDVNVTVSGLTVGGIDDDDAVYFIYNIDGSITTAALQVAPCHSLPPVGSGEQLVVFGIRCNNDFWFKNGQKWEVGEFKPFGVTSKYPNLKVGETGNPPSAEQVSGIFFDNAQVFVQPGGRDVHIFVNVSGSIPEQPIEEHFLTTSTSGQISFTTTDPDLFWVFDHERTDISVFRNGQRLVQFNPSTSGMMDINGDPIWSYKKAGTRTVETRTPLFPSGVLTIRLEADKGINAYEETYHVSSVSGQSLFTTAREFSPDNNVKDITVWRNGQKTQFDNAPFDSLVHGGYKISNNQFLFTPTTQLDSVVTFRWESSQVAGGGGGGGTSGIFWYTPVDSHINPDTDNAYDLGITRRFRNGNFGGDLGIAGDVYIGGKLNVSGGIDPEYIQLDPQLGAGAIPSNSLYIDQTAGYQLRFKDNFGTTIPVISGLASGVSPLENEVMTNPYPFDIIAPKAVSVSTSGSFFFLTDYEDPSSLDNFFGILTQNVSAFGIFGDAAPVQWRGRVPVVGFTNGAVYVSGDGELSQSLAGVSGFGILKTGVVKDNYLFLRPGEALNL